jgi:hypothetical protein
LIGLLVRLIVLLVGLLWLLVRLLPGWWCIRPTGTKRSGHYRSDKEAENYADHYSDQEQGPGVREDEYEKEQHEGETPYASSAPVRSSSVPHYFFLLVELINSLVSYYTFVIRFGCFSIAM